MRIPRNSAFVLLLALALTLAACASGTSTTTGSTTGNSPTATTAPAATDTPAATGGPATISMAGFAFTGNKTVTIKAGESVTFDDPGDGGGVHQLVTGTDGQFTAVAGAPKEFATSSGTMFSPGVSMTITFSKPGTYLITCTIHPSMQATVIVQ